jgi:hypothetical protein
MTKTASITLRVTKEVKAAIEEAATADSRSVAGLVDKVLTEYLRQNGWIRRKARPRPSAV